MNGTIRCTVPPPQADGEHLIINLVNSQTRNMTMVPRKIDFMPKLAPVLYRSPVGKVKILVFEYFRILKFEES